MVNKIIRPFVWHDPRGRQNRLLDWTVYRTAFVYFDVGYGSAMAIFSLFLTIALCSLMFRQLMKSLGMIK